MKRILAVLALAFAPALVHPRPAAALLRFAGSIPLEDLHEMAEAIEEGCEPTRNPTD